MARNSRAGARPRGLAVMAMAAVLVVAATGCRVELGVLGEGESLADVNGRGLAAGERSLGGEGWTWDTATGTRRELRSGSVLAAGVDAEDVNGAGAVAGTVWERPMGDAGNAPNRARATLWRPDGTEVHLDPGFPYFEARAVALNDEGIVVGLVRVQVGVEEGLPDYDTFVVRWSVGPEGVTVVDSVRTYTGDAVAVNGRGQVVGNYWQAWRWDPATDAVTTLTVPGSVYARATGINDRGEVVGTATFGHERGPTRAVRWDATGTATVLPDLGGTGSVAVAINEAGVVAGHGTRPDGVQHAFRVDPGSAVALDLGGGSTVPSSAVSVSPSGAVYGTEEDRTVVRWDPDAPAAG
jgi:uncharacterized membrane protein